MLFRQLHLHDITLREIKSINKHQTRHLIEISITRVLTFEQFPDEMKGWERERERGRKDVIFQPKISSIDFSVFQIIGQRLVLTEPSSQWRCHSRWSTAAAAPASLITGGWEQNIYTTKRLIESEAECKSHNGGSRKVGMGHMKRNRARAAKLWRKGNSEIRKEKEKGTEWKWEKLDSVTENNRLGCSRSLAHTNETRRKIHFSCYKFPSTEKFGSDLFCVAVLNWWNQFKMACSKISDGQLSPIIHSWAKSRCHEDSNEPSHCMSCSSVLDKQMMVRYQFIYC